MEEEKKEVNYLKKWIKKYQGFSEFLRVTTTKTGSKKVTIMVGTFLKGNCIRSLFKRAIGYNYQQVVAEYVKVSTTQTASEKVDTTVTTFLNFDS